jgi:hypothetical protein
MNDQQLVVENARLREELTDLKAALAALLFPEKPNPAQPQLVGVHWEDYEGK